MSGWRSKKALIDHKFSWTQPYQMFSKSPQSLRADMAVIEAVDRLVESGLTSPEIESIIKNIVNNSKRQS